MGNMKYQLFQAIDNAFSPGYKRYTADDYHGERIVSYADRKALRDTASDFAKFCKAEGIKKASKIKAETVSKWLQQKADEGCSESTIKTYMSRMAKLGLVVREKYGVNVDYRGEMPKLKEKSDEKLRTVAMSRDDLSKALDTMRPMSKSRIAIELSAAFGLRVSETVKIKAEHVDMQKGVLHIVGAKGGRNRDLWIRTDAQKQALEKALRLDKHVGGYLLAVKAGSVNKALSRALEKLGITKYNDHKTGLHSIRKMYATERYNELRNRGMTHKTAWGTVSEELGHGRDRQDLFAVYVVK